jgi:hypothetical protein
MPVCLSATFQPAACLPACQAYLRACLSIRLPPSLSARLPVCLSTNLPAFLPACLPSVPVCHPAFLPFCLPVFLPLCLPAYKLACRWLKFDTGYIADPQLVQGILTYRVSNSILLLFINNISPSNSTPEIALHFFLALVGMVLIF